MNPRKDLQKKYVEEKAPKAPEHNMSSGPNRAQRRRQIKNLLTGKGSYNFKKRLRTQMKDAK
jgi:hypothetical protein